MRVVTTKLSDRIAKKHADADAGDEPVLPALASLVMSLVTAGREATNEKPQSVGDVVANSLVASADPTTYPIPTGVTVEEVHPPLLWLQKIPVVGTFVVTPVVTLLHALPIVGDFLQPIIGFPIDHFAPPGTPEAKSYRRDVVRRHRDLRELHAVADVRRERPGRRRCSTGPASGCPARRR